MQTVFSAKYVRYNFFTNGVAQKSICKDEAGNNLHMKRNGPTLCSNCLKWGIELSFD